MSWQIAARMPGIFAAATEAPTPDPQIEDAAIRIAVEDRAAELERLVGIVDPRLGPVGPEVDRFVAERGEILEHALPQLHSSMVEPDGDPHTSNLPRRKMRRERTSEGGGMTEVDNWRELGQQLRVDSIRAANVTKSGHPTSSMSAADLMAVLMSKYLHYDYDQPENPNNDHLIFSKGHASPLVYSMFKAAGAITDEELLTFRVFGSRMEGHPTPEIPWVDVATGSLGQGLPISVGVALAGKNLDRLPYRVWCLCGDSEMAEGSMWEAFEHAAFYELENLTAIIDVNRLGQRGETMHGWDLNSYAKRAEAFGWKAIEIDGHDFEEIDRAYAEALHTHGQPTVIVAHTLKGKGVKEVENQLNWHGKALDHPDEAIEELGGIRNIVVDVPKPESSDEPHRFEVPGGELPAYELGGKDVATRTAYGEALARARQHARRRRRRRRRGVELDVCRVLPRRPSRPLLRDVHRRAADGRHGCRPAGAQLAPVRLHLRRLPLARLRLRPHGGDQPRQLQPVRLARRRVDRRGRAVADGARGSGGVPRDPLQHRALPLRREPDRAARGADGRPARHQVHAHDPRGHAGDLRGRTRSSRSAAAASSARPTRTT